MPIPSPKKGESKEEFVSRFMSNESMKKEFKDNKQRLAVAHSQFKKFKGKKEHICINNLSIKEDEDSLIVEGLVATSHPDRVNDILSENALVQIRDCINNDSKVGDENGAYRLVSLSHDWIHEGDPSLDAVAFIKPSAEIVELEDGHKGVKVTAELNKHYKGDSSIDEIKYRIDNDYYGGFSIEYNTDEEHSKSVDYNGESYRFIEELTGFGGTGLARSRLIANPQAVIYKEILNKVKEGGKMAEEEVPKEVPPAEEPAKEEEKAVEEPKEEEKKVEEKELNTEKIISGFKEAVREILTVKNKPIIQTKEDVKMEKKEIPLSIKEMRESIKNKDTFSFKEAARSYLNEHNASIASQMRGSGIPLNTTLQVKCVNKYPGGMGMGKLQIVNNIETKDTLDTTTNTTTYTQNIVEFADVYIPGIVDTFNNQINLFGALPKRDHIEGGDKYGWRIKTNQSSSLAVDPDVTTVNKENVLKTKLQTKITEYRVGVSVSDYTLYHSRASIGDLFMIEVEGKSRDLLRDINNDLFTEQVDGTNKVLGLEAVADSAGNTTLYGLTRSTTNRLSPATASDTYLALGSITTSAMRAGIKNVEVEGALRQNLRIVVNPAIRDFIFNIEDTKIRYMNEPNLGFFGAPAFDGIPMIVDSSAQTDAMFVVDFESEYLVISKSLTLTGLAKVGAAEEGFLSIYLAHVYEQPRRIYMLDSISLYG